MSGNGIDTIEPFKDQIPLLLLILGIALWMYFQVKYNPNSNSAFD